MMEIMIDDKQGGIWDVSRIASDVVWKTSRIGKPGSLEFTLIKGGLYEDRSFSYRNGDIVRVRADGRNVFYGYIFNIDGGRNEAVKITAYDQLRYLMNTETYHFVGVTAADVIRRIAADFGLQLGRIDEPSYVIPKMSEDGQKLMDIIDKALALTLVNSGQNFVLYDDFGLLSLRLVDDLLVDFIVGDGSLMTNYTYKQSIDSDTYNQFKLVRDDKESDRILFAKSNANIVRWGVLQYYEKVNEQLNDAQMKQRLYTLAALKNREMRSLNIEAIGDLRIRAGSYVRIVIQEYGIDQPFLVDHCTHRLGDDPTMSLELKVI
ncbi:XkdQ/YqbQ family protein [Paenibacillus ginsengihumi]|uniref:XkdQ/YqbQ family protein n=1 Tax=Paenibacillus ginsengihumi TaxID=431596 RepID=UPI0003738DDE|nr:hypothetical protein [Paenibacillus ginsengihumi]